MDEIIFYYEGNTTKIKYDGNQKIREICDKFCNQINKSINSLVFKYEGSELNMDKTFDEIKQENKNNIFVCKIDENKSSESKNEINCIYDKQDEEINLLHDYSIDKECFNSKDYMIYKEGEKNINENNIDIYIDGNKIKFNSKYKSEERGEIKVKFKFNKLITSTHDMFSYCSSLKYIDLSSFNSSQVVDIGFMFFSCSSLKSIDLSRLDTSKVINMNDLFLECKNLETINLTSLDTSNVINMNQMFCGCESLKSIDLSSFITNKVNDLRFMFSRCSSLKSIDLTTFKISENCTIQGMFSDCKSLKKENIKIDDSLKRIFGEIKTIKK